MPAHASSSTNEGLSLRVGFRTRSLSDERLRFIKQIGVDDVFVDHAETAEDLHGFVGETGRDGEFLRLRRGDIPSVEDVVKVRNRIEDAGLRMGGVQSIPFSLYGKIMLGLEGADEQLADLKTLVRNLGKANVPILGYQWNPRGEVVMRTSDTKPVRGGARTTAFDLSDLDEPEISEDPDAPEYSEAEFWDNYERFLREILPVAEEAGVRLALHPADPPVIERLQGIPRLFRSFESFERAMELVPSDNHGLKLCLGCFSEMGDDVTEVIRYFGERDEIVFVHFRDVEGTMPAFHETFLDEGNFDAYEAVKALRDVDFSGVMLLDHVPNVEGDTDWGHRARGSASGYLRGLVRAALAEQRQD